VDGSCPLTIYKVEVRGFTANADRVQENITTIPFHLPGTIQSLPTIQQRFETLTDFAGRS
jgi:hypothetical protein